MARNNLYIRDLKEIAQRLHDDPYEWIRNFCYTVDEKENVSKLIPTAQQKELIEKLDHKVIVLKSRQLGCSTILLSYALYRCMTQPQSNCLLMVHQAKLTTELKQRMIIMHNNLPDFAKSPIKRSNKDFLEFQNGSMVTFGVDGKEYRGFTFSFIHISEMSSMRPTIKNQLVALSDALRPDGILCVESTALGYNSFSDLWFSSQKEHSTWTPLFYSWLQDRVMNKSKYENAAKRYMNRHNLKKLPTFEELGLDDEEISLVDRGMTVEMCLWRREYIDDRGIDAFHQEQPDSPLRAFVSTGNNVFDTALINEKLNELHKYPILAQYPKELTENKILKPYCNLRFNNPKLKIWRLPENKDEMFFLGVDTSDGLSGNHDYSVISVWDEDCIQVAEFRDNGTKPFKFADIVELIGTFYNHGLLIIERNASGNTVTEKLSSKLTLAGKPYPNLYRQRDLDHKKSKVGFTTSVKTKSQIVTYFQNMFDEDDLLIKSKDLLTEMQLYIGKGDGKTEASIDFDDCVMAGCLAIGAGWKDRTKQYKRAFSASSIIRRGLF